MGAPLQGIRPPAWLDGVEVISHVRGGIWEIRLTGYGRTLVGPYNELKGYISAQGLGEDAHHIVGKEHLKVTRTGYTSDNAPAVALERRLHNSQISPRITGEQKYLGGRGSPRPIASRAEIRNLYRSIYTWHTKFQELATISNNVLADRPPVGRAPVPAGSAPVGDPAVGNRLASGAPMANVKTPGPTAVTQDARMVGEPGTATRQPAAAAPRTGALAIPEGAAPRSAVKVVGKATLQVGRVLLRVISRVLVVLNILDVAELILLAARVIKMGWDNFRDRAMDRAIEEYIKSRLAHDMTAALEKHQDEIARHYAREWLKKTSFEPTFLYLSPRLTVTGFYGKDGFKFDVELIVKSIEKDLVLVSVAPLEPRRDELPEVPLSYHFEVRWSVEQPVYTPFDIYRAFTDYFAEHVVSSWVAHNASGRKLGPELITQFHSIVRTLAHISATLKYESYFGWDPKKPGISADMAGWERHEALNELSATILHKLMPAVSALESQQLIYPGIARWDSILSPLRSELDPQFETSLIPFMRRIAFDMQISAKDLEYERLEDVKHNGRMQSNMKGSIEIWERSELYRYLQPFAEHLPNKLIPDAPPEPFEKEPKSIRGIEIFEE